jgi:hypothetical protein
MSGRTNVQNRLRDRENRHTKYKLERLEPKWFLRLSTKFMENIYKYKIKSMSTVTCNKFDIYVHNQAKRKKMIHKV